MRQNRVGIAQRLRGALLAFLIAVPAGAGATIDFKDDTWSNEELGATYLLEFIVYAAGVALGLVPEPVTNLAGEASQLSIELSLKGLPPILQPPEAPDAPIYPNAPLIEVDAKGNEIRTDSCSFKFVMPLSHAGFSNISGLLNYREHVLGGFTWRKQQRVEDVLLSEVERIEACLAPELAKENPPSVLKLRWMCDLPANNWGVVGFPRLYHVLSDAAVGLSSFTGGIQNIDQPQVVNMPAGHHQLNWDAETYLNVLGDAFIPLILLAAGIMTEVKVAKDAKKIAAQAEQLKNTDGKALSEVTMQANEFLSAQKAAKRFKERMKKILDNDNPLIDEATSKTDKFLAELIGANYGKWDLVTELTKRVAGSGSESLLGDDIFNLVTARNFASTWMSVYDLHPPELTTIKDEFVLEATDFGGVRYGRVAKQVADSVEASDACGRDFNLQLAVRTGGGGDEGPVPDLLPIGEEIELVWTITDLGPNPPVGNDLEHGDVPRDENGNYQLTREQTLIVRDTQPPLLKAPPGKVIETEQDFLPTVRDPQTNEPFVGGQGLGQPLVVDLADPEPEIAEDAPDQFPVGTRTAVRWTAVDDWNNLSEDFQLITVKATGTNNPPQATPVATGTLTALPKNIDLNGWDPDLLDGARDPLSFHIEANPQHGEFVAPLYPYFITDYRSHENSEDDEGLYEAVATDQVATWFRSNICEKDFCGGQAGCDNEEEREARVQEMRERVFEPLFVHVLDDGTRYVLDYERYCQLGDVEAQRRISVFDKKEEFIGRLIFDQDDGPHDDTFRIGKDSNGGYLEFTEQLASGTSSEFGLQRCAFDESGLPGLCQELVEITGSTFADSSDPDNPYLVVEYVSSAVRDPVSDLYYINDGLDIAVLDSGGRLLGLLLPDGHDSDLDGPFLGGCTGRVPPPGVDWPPGGIDAVRRIGFSMLLDEERNLYVVDSCVSRIHKFNPAVLNAEGALSPADYAGWLGKCNTSTNKACDEDLKRSKGFACTDETCTLDPGEGSWGGQAGQFDLPLYLAIDPNGLIYVADYFNLRVQRFGADGVFAGQAQSNENGVVSPDKPSFVLGNMPAPRALAVNSTQFFVTDRQERFVHIFGTLPFKDITDDSAVVTYVSYHDFHSASDSFEYSVSDGLATSDPVEVTIQVDRNFRPPEALDDEQQTTEDVPITFQLLADDPDGVKEIDFNGLDELTYHIERYPNHGSLSVRADGRVTYRPEAEFFGNDSFHFTVNDGVFDSRRARVEIDVLPKNDAPTVTAIDLPERIGRGLGFSLQAAFTDDTNYEHQATIDWGDGTQSLPGSIELDEDTDELTLTGAVLTEATHGASGDVRGNHVYEAEGEHTVSVCVEDGDQQTGCESITALVETLSQLTLEASVPDGDLQDGLPIPYSIEIAAAQPSDGSGLASENVSAVIEVDEQLTVESVTLEAPTSAAQASTGARAAPKTNHGACAIAGREIQCEFGTLRPGESRVLHVAARFAERLVYDGYPQLYVQATSPSEAAWPTVESMLEVEVLADTTDFDGDGMSDAYEEAHGLNPQLDDAAGDLDGDGLSNKEEFDYGTAADRFDTDGDGLGDGAEWNHWLTDPLLADTDGDQIPDGWEIENGLDPFRNDALEDADGDGVTNLDEYLWDTNPNDDADAVHLNIPTLSREGLVLLVLALMVLGWVNIRQR